MNPTRLPLQMGRGIHQGQILPRSPVSYDSPYFTDKEAEDDREEEALGALLP